MPGPLQLGCQYGGKTRPTLLQKGTIVEQPNRVDNAPQWVCRIDPSQHGLQLRTVGDITLRHSHGNPLGKQSIHLALRFGLGSATP